MPSFEDDPTYYYDWEGEEEFVLEDLGPGECAGGALEMIDNRILEAEQELYQGRLLLDKHQYAVAVNKAYRAVLSAAKALLVTEGLDPSTDAETLAEFERLFAGRNVVHSSYRNLVAQIDDLGPKDTTPEFARAKTDFATGFVEACKTATEQIGKDLKLKIDEGESSPASASQVSTSQPAQSAAQSGIAGVRSSWRGLPHKLCEDQAQIGNDGCRRAIRSMAGCRRTDQECADEPS